SNNCIPIYEEFTYIIQSDEMTDIFSGEVQYYFEHSLDLSIELIKLTTSLLYH
ncbi:14087_t:CDS:2, partial [Funneliformis geosporum]